MTWLQIDHTYEHITTKVRHNVFDIVGKVVHTRYTYPPHTEGEILWPSRWRISDFGNEDQWIDVTPVEDKSATIPDYLYQRDNDI